MAHRRALCLCPTRDMEIFALFISCMCHDLDHRGTNNSFQVAPRETLPLLTVGTPPPGCLGASPSSLRGGGSS